MENCSAPSILRSYHKYRLFAIRAWVVCSQSLYKIEKMSYKSSYSNYQHYDCVLTVFTLAMTLTASIWPCLAIFLISMMIFFSCCSILALSLSSSLIALFNARWFFLSISSGVILLPKSHSILLTKVDLSLNEASLYQRGTKNDCDSHTEDSICYLLRRSSLGRGVGCFGATDFYKNHLFIDHPMI